jgi:hypothetical protein
MPVVYARMDTVLGLLELAFYVTSILALSAGVTYLVVRFSPSRGKRPKAEKSQA